MVPELRPKGGSINTELDREGWGYVRQEKWWVGVGFVS